MTHLWTAQVFAALLCLTPSGAQAADARAQLLAVPLSPELGGNTTRPVATKEAFTFVAGNASEDHKALFSKGNAVFISEWVAAPGFDPAFDGLGPMFNRESCIACHVENGRGAPPSGPKETLDTSLVRVSIPGPGPLGGPNPVPIYGDQIQDRAIKGVPPEAIPSIRWREVTGRYGDGEGYTLRRPDLKLNEPAYGKFPKDILTSIRMSNPVIGMGLLEAVPEDLLKALADDKDANGDGVSGRANLVYDMDTKTERVGRFGWKANVASLKHQNAAAALSDMGITTAMMPRDLCRPEQVACANAARATRPARGSEMSDEQVEHLLLYMRLIAVPRQRNPDAPEVKRGEVVFRELGCADCHTPTLRTDDTAALPELRNQTFHPFTDLLIHDMGPGLADGRRDSLAEGNEWRTAPLWGIGLTQKVNGHTFFLHDGRARNLAEAILWHGGEAQRAKESFRTATKATRDDLLAFLGSL
jgi:CxxC motif-containing protein (DUF1111 family)